MMIDLYNEYGLILISIVILVVFLLIIILVLTRNKKHQSNEVEETKQSQDTMIKDPVTLDQNQDVMDLEEEQLLETSNDVVIKDEINDDSQEEDDPKNDVLSKDKPLKYHVSQNKDVNSPYYKHWRVRKEGSDKTIKYYKTQKEAISVADRLALKAGSRVVIHKVDGKIRKQDYWKKKK